MWERFHAALEVPDAERAAWLAVEVADPAERSELNRMLAAHVRTGTVLDQPVHPAAEPGTRSTIGSWHKLRQIGQGGMGTVWLAERETAAGVVQRAALKCVAAQRLAEPSLLARFRREQRILARLEHPDIARLLDAGIDDAGLPWLAMEYIDGMPLLDWVAHQAPPLATRLQLVIRLCGAVQYAHQQLVVHRDLKPANVLVRPDGRPVLLDFGIAALLEPATGPEQTGTAMPLALTPRYASPEQLRGQPVGTASDVYSLGCVLYELLTGAPPFAAPGTDWAGWVAEVVARMPPAPGMLTGALAIDRELDAIVLQCLRKEPERRYVSAAALAEDLGRLLAHKPVRARPDTVRYRLRKFVRRHRVGVAASLLMAVLLALFGLRLAIEQQRTAAALAQSELQRTQADATVAFLTDIFREADPTRAGARRTTAELLARGVDLLAQRPLDAGNKARIAIVLGEILINTGDYARAEALFRQTLDATPAGDLRRDALVGLGGAQLAATHYAEARRTLQAALAPEQPDGSADASLARAAALERLGAAEQALGQRQSAHAALAEALAIRQARLPVHDPRIADVRLRLGGLAWSDGDFAAAHSHYQAALATRRRESGEPAELARVLDALGGLAHVQGQFAQATVHYSEALALRRQVLGERHRLTADTLGNLGALAYDRGDPAAAIAPLEQALAVQLQVLGQDSPVVARTLNNLGLALAAVGERARARSLLQQALDINRKSFGEQHPRVAGNLNNLGLVLLDDAQAPAAETLFVQALEIQQTQLPADDPQRGFALTNLGRARLELGQVQQAERDFAAALTLRRQKLGKDHPALAETLTWYGVLRCEQGDAEQGAALLDEAQAVRARAFGAAHVSIVQTRVLLRACAPAWRAVATDAEVRRIATDAASGAPLKRRLR